MFYVYILRCADGTFYVGRTDNLDLRMARHEEGRGGPYTRTRRPVSLVYSENHSTTLAARTRERQLKRWSRAKKEALIRGDLRELKAL